MVLDVVKASSILTVALFIPSADPCMSVFWDRRILSKRRSDSVPTAKTSSVSYCLPRDAPVMVPPSAISSDASTFSSQRRSEADCVPA